MKNPRRILVAIKDPASRSQPALHKAAQLAGGSGARLELFHALAVPMYPDAYTLEGQSLQKVQREWRERAQQRLEKLAAPLRAEGLKVTTDSEWDFPAYEAVIRRAQQGKADLIVAERHATRHVLPWLLRFNDWELLRRSPVPVLLVKRAGRWRKPAVIAAIDPAHSFAKPARLDDSIIAAADTLSSALGGTLHVAHAWADLPASSRITAAAPGIALALDQRARRAARAAFDRALEKAGAANAKKHFVAGSPDEVLPKLARRQRAGIVVMGAISRSGLKRLVVGNIAEQVLDALPCDVLVVKPAQFKARVPAKGRGVQLIPTPPYI
jgi:universal stress protein E